MKSEWKTAINKARTLGDPMFRSDPKPGCFLAMIGMWAVSVLGSLALLGAIIYVAWHFIAKYW